MRGIATIALVVVALATAGFADPVDGSTSDWGTISNTANPDILSYSFNPGVHFVTEDTSTYYVGPAYGGQKYDAEAIFFRADGSTFRGGLITGFDLLNGESSGISSPSTFTAGDFLIDVGCNGLYDYALDISSYDGTAHTVDLVKLKGDNSDLKPVFYAANVVATPWLWNGVGTVIGQADAYIGQATNLTGDHQLFEFSFTAPGAFAGASICEHWTMQCGNDYLNVDGVIPNPEPSTFVLFGALAAALFLLQRRRGARV